MRSEDSSKVALGCMLLLSLPVFGIWHSYALMKLWEWFVVAHFGAKHLTMPVAYGLCIVINVATARKPPKEDDPSSNEYVIRSVVHMALVPAIGLAVGWVVKGFM